MKKFNTKGKLVASFALVAILASQIHTFMKPDMEHISMDEYTYTMVANQNQVLFGVRHNCGKDLILKEFRDSSTALTEVTSGMISNTKNLASKNGCTIQTVSAEMVPAEAFDLASN